MRTLPTITTFPRHTLRDLWAHSGPMQPILDSYDRLYTFGRDAIYWGLKCLGPEPAKFVWMPSFHCGVEVQAALDAGFNVSFYRIQPDLTIDEDDLAQKLAARPGPVMIIHYFGFVQPGLKRLVDLCKRYEVALIEDCSHALFSIFDGRPVGQYGHFAAFSLYKTLALCDGGALLLNQKSCQSSKGSVQTTPHRGRPSLQGYQIQLRALFKKVLGPLVARRYQALRSSLRNPSAGPGSEKTDHADHPLMRRSHNYRGGMSILSYRLASTMDPSLIIHRRIENWRFLDHRLSTMPGYHNVFKVLPEGVCPLYLPIWLSQREALRDKLSDWNIETFIFGKYPHPRMNKSNFPETAAMRNRILCLPLHQYMDNEQLTRLAKVVGPLLDEHGVRN